MRLVGSLEEQVVEESRETIDAQVDALVAETINVVMLPAGSCYIPVLPEGFERIRASGIGAGTYFFNPQKVTGELIAEAAEEGLHGRLLGHIQTKREVGWNVVAVCAVLPSGVTVQDSAVSATDEAMIEAQKRVLASRHPSAEIVVKNPARVVAMRSQFS